MAGTADMPVIIRAEQIGSDTLDDGTYFDLRHCSYITIQGFVINITEKSTTFKIQTCNNIRITQNVMDGSGEDYYKDDGVERNSSVWINLQSLWDDETGLSHHNRIDHNVLKNKHTLGNMIRIDGTDDLYVSHHDVIEYNYFKNMGPRATNEMEAIRIGWSAMSESDGFCTVSNNLFEECNGDPEIISVKCNKNTISHNTFLRCEGTLSLRHGNETVVDGNFFLGEEAEGTGGVRIYGSDHRIINNYFEGLTGTKWDAPITLTYGDAEEGNGNLTKHFRIERAIIANNTLVNNHHGIEIGYDNQDKYSKPPRDVVLAYNLISSDTNSLVKYINPPSNISWVDNLMHVSDDATLGDGVTFVAGEILEVDPLLSWNDGEGLFRSEAASPQYTASSVVTNESIAFDMDGQLRSVPTQYGADEYQSAAIVYAPLTPKDVGTDVGEYLQVSLGSLAFQVHRDTIAVGVSSNLDWEAESDQPWIILEQTQGSGDGYIRIIAEENESGAVRTGNVSVQSTNAEGGLEITKDIIITQSDKEDPILTVPVSELSFTSVAAQEVIVITSNVSWTASTDSDWIILNPAMASGSADLTIQVEENDSRSGRNGSLTITDGVSLTYLIDISQDGTVGTEEKLTIVDAIASTEQAEDGNVADNVYDGLLSNRWSGEGDGAYISLELEAKSKLSFIKVGLYKGSERNSYFDLQSSLDGITYYDLLTNITSEITDDEFVLYDFQDTTAKYIRLVGHGNSTSSWNSYTEFEVWGWELEPETKVEEQSGLTSFLYYPNPTKGILHLQLNKPTSGKITIFDQLGRALIQMNLSEPNTSIDLSEYSTGVYYFRLVLADEEAHTGKIVIE